MMGDIIYIGGETLNYTHLPPSEKKRRICSPENLLFFLILFGLLVYRTPDDFFQPYLWAEDGSVLIQGSIYNGISGLFVPVNGTYWVIQKLVALLCYWLVLPTNSIAALPYLMQIFSKILGTLSVMYFISDRFQWLVPKKIYRFGICAAIILLMPQHSYDVLTCETSLPFELFFAAFLIGLDLLCSGKYEMPNWGQAFFLTILSLSTASALCIAAIVVAAFFQWIFVQIQTKILVKSRLGIELVKLGIILAAVAVQLRLVFFSGRVNDQLDIANRLILNTKSFTFFPYWNEFHSWTAFVIGLGLWAIICYMTKLPWKVVSYCGGFSYLFMLYCSMVSTAEMFYQGKMTGRFIFTCFEISALLIGVAAVKLIDNTRRSNKYTGCVILGMIAIVSIRTYDVSVIGNEVSEIYKRNCGVYTKNGGDMVRIPIGPFNWWYMTIPASISAERPIHDLEFGVEYLDGILTGSENFGQLRKDCVGNEHELIGWARTSVENQTFERLFIKNGSTYTAAHEITERAMFYEDAWTHNGFIFFILEDYFNEGATTIELVGETADGTWHYGAIDIATSFNQEAIT